MKLTNNPILLFDGNCNLCNNSVKFIFKHEKKPTLLFASLQSEKGIELLKQMNNNNHNLDSIVFIKNRKIYIKSSAALRLALYLKGLYPLLFCLLIIPPFIRNRVYDFIAKNRYKWFGKTESCMIPDKSISNRFL